MDSVFFTLRQCQSHVPIIWNKWLPPTPTGPQPHKNTGLVISQKKDWPRHTRLSLLFYYKLPLPIISEFPNNWITLGGDDYLFTQQMMQWDYTGIIWAEQSIE
jgi:hypothetical protein